MELAVGQKVKMKSKSEQERMGLDYFTWLNHLKGKILTVGGTKTNNSGKELIYVKGYEEDWLFPKRFILVGSQTETEE